MSKMSSSVLTPSGNNSQGARDLCSVCLRAGGGGASFETALVLPNLMQYYNDQSTGNLGRLESPRV